MDSLIPQNDWKEFFENEMKKEYFLNIEESYSASVKNNDIIYPCKENIFRVFELCPLSEIKVVILGQDPYPGICSKSKTPYACGLSFSTDLKCKSIPKSLQNMFKELEKSGYEKPSSGDISHWVTQGVFLLNTLLTVKEGQPNSHKFWEAFTQEVIRHIVQSNKNAIFLLMGAKSLKCMEYIHPERILITSHPSPLSYKKKMKSYESFHDSKIFLKINQKLKDLNISEIKW